MSHIKISNKDAHLLAKAQNRKELTITGNTEIIQQFNKMAKNYNKEYRKRFGYREYTIGKLNINIENNA